MSKTRNVSMTHAAIYGLRDGKFAPSIKQSERHNEFYDDGKSILMSMTEFIAGVEQYADILNAGRHEYFTLHIQGEEFAVVKPFNEAANEEHPSFELQVMRQPLGKAKALFTKAAEVGPLTLAYNQNEFGVLIPLYELAQD